MFDRHVREQALIRPDDPAVVTPAGSVSFRKLNDDIDRAVQAIDPIKVDADEAVAVAMRQPYLRWVMVLAFARRGIATAPASDGGARIRVGDAVGKGGEGQAIFALTEEMIDHILNGPVAPETSVDVDPDSIGRIYMSSGTIGQAKRIGVTWRQVDIERRNAQVELGEPPRGRWFAGTGIDTGYGMSVGLACWATGNTLILGFSANMAGIALGAKPSLMALVPSQISSLVDGLPKDAERWPIRIVSGGGPVSPKLLSQVRARLTEDFVNLYGASEAGYISVTRKLLPEDEEGVVGQIVPGLELEVRDERGVAQPPGVVGRLFMRGRRVVGGYLDDPKATAAAFKDGWWDSGDLGRLSEDGVLTMAGRADDIMNIGGHKILPAKIEEAALACAGVAEAAAFPFADERGMQQCCLALVTNPEFDLQHLSQALGAHLQYLGNLTIRYVDAMPRNSMGKVDRKRLLELAPSRPLS